MKDRKPANFSPFREGLHEFIFEADTKAGRGRINDHDVTTASGVLLVIGNDR